MTDQTTNPGAAGVDDVALKGAVTMIANNAIYTKPNSDEPEHVAGEEFKVSEKQAADLEKSGAARRKEAKPAKAKK